MIQDLEYKQFESELKSIMNSDRVEDQLECAYHYGHFGFNAYCLRYLQKAQYADQEKMAAHFRQLDALHVSGDLAENNFSRSQRGNCDFLTATEIEVEFKEYENNQREIGIYIQALPYIEILRNLGKVKHIKINCNDRLRELFELYFPYVEIGTCANKVNQHELIEYVGKNGGAALVRQAIKNISNRIRTNKNPRFLGINWFANNIYDRYRSIPIGTLINTVGNHPKDLGVMSLQYNDPSIEIDIYNKYSKNKIVEVFNNDINTTPVEILNAVAQCYCVVGIQSEPIMMAAWVLGIPTIVTASSPNFYWYFLNQMNPNLHTVQMRFAGDYDYVIKNINKWI